MKKGFMDRFYQASEVTGLHKGMELSGELNVEVDTVGDGFYLDNGGDLGKSAFYDILEKGAVGAERAGHRWASREMRPGGGYVYHYTHASGSKHDVHEDKGSRNQIEGRNVTEHGQKALEHAKAADEHFGAGREKEGMKSFKQAVKHREAQEILRHHGTSRGKND